MSSNFVLSNNFCPLLFRYYIDSEQTTPITGINYFTINETTGDISVFRSLELDTSSTSVYKLQIQARDMGM